MPDANEFVKVMKKAAIEAMNATKPVNVYFGEVVSTAPLRINVEQKMILGETQLILTQNVTDYTTMVTVNWESGEALKTAHRHGLAGTTTEDGDPSHSHILTGNTDTTDLKHGHVITGQKQITMHNALKVGDHVVIVRQQEGQKFIVIDRIGGI